MATPVVLKQKQAEYLGNILTRELKSIIKEKGLYDTGFMFDISNSKVTVNKTVGVFRISIESPTYFKYLDEKYQLTQTLLKSNSYKTALQKFEDFVTDNIYDEILVYKQISNKKK